MTIMKITKKINPDFRTNPKDYSKVEIAKINSGELRGGLFNEFRDYSSQNISWESEQIANLLLKIMITVT
jgi:hypothetical protein